MKIPITKTVFGPEEMAAVQRPLESGWVVQGPYVKQFETNTTLTKSNMIDIS